MARGDGKYRAQRELMNGREVWCACVFTVLVAGMKNLERERKRKTETETETEIVRENKVRGEIPSWRLVS